MDYKQKMLDELTEEINVRKEAIDGTKIRIKRRISDYQEWGMSMNDPYVKKALDSEDKLIDTMQKTVDAYQKVVDGINDGSIKVIKPE